MSREIKFRSFKKSTATMVDLYKITPFAIAEGLKQDGLFLPFSDDFVLMQFTGVKDVNGIEIYEGDILQYKSYYVNKRWWNTISDIEVIEQECKRQREDFYTTKAEVVFQDGSFNVNYSITMKDVSRGQRFKTGQSHSCDTEEKQWDFEVIGNIYQNPELLTS